LPEVLLHPAQGATAAVLLAGLVNALDVGRRSGPLDLACLAVIVAVSGAALATVLRRVAARA